MSNSKNSKLHEIIPSSVMDRRSVIRGAGQLTGAAAAPLSGLLHKAPVLAPLLASGTSLRAEDREAGSSFPFTLVLITVIDKTQQRTFQIIPGDPAQMTGIDGDGGRALTESTFRGRGLTNLFGDALNGLPDNVSLCINNGWTSNVGGHSLQTANLGMDHGGINYLLESRLKETAQNSLFGAIGIALSSSANAAEDAFVGPGGKRERSFDTVSDLRRTLQNAVRPLEQARDSASLLHRLDRLKVPNPTFRDSLGALAERITASIPELTTAEAQPDAIMQQALAVIACHRAGLSNNFMITVPHDDTNGGGDLTDGGGERMLSPMQTTEMLGRALVALHQAIPNLIVVTCGDGGRSANNGDAGPGMAMISGPRHLIRDVTLVPVPDVTRVGTNVGDVLLSTGVRAVASQANWLATALHVMGIDIGVPWVAEAVAA